MKDISMYFAPVENNDHYKDDQWGSVIKAHRENDFPEIIESGIVIFDIEGSEFSKSNASILREAFYDLYVHTSTTVYDLGILKIGAGEQDQIFALKEVVSELIKNNCIPFSITSSKEMQYELFCAYESLEQLVNIAHVSPQIDFSNENPQALLTKIFTHDKGVLFNYSNLGFQSYYCSKDTIAYLEEFYFDAVRLGVLRNHIELFEPYLRNTDLVLIDLNAINRSSYWGNTLQAPNGFAGDELCRITRYAGIADKLNQVSMLVENPIEMHDAVLIAQSIWYFIEGFDQRKGDFPVRSKKKYKKFVVGVKDFKDEINFYKSDRSGRWWMEVPYPGNGNKKFQRHYMVPCTKKDYESALKDDLPDLWWKTYQKLT